MEEKINMDLHDTPLAGRKKTYSAPSLVNFGEVHQLTQTGSQQGAESGAPQNTKKSATPSDCRLKENVVRIGMHPLGIGIYLFDYKQEYRDQCGHGRQFGVIAQEVETVMPEAVLVHPDGYKMVDYGMLGIRRADN